MKSSNYNNRDYYPGASQNGYSTTRSVAQKRHNLSLSKVSEDKSKFQTRIQKACPTNSIDAYRKEVALLKKQLQRLQKQNLKKDNKIFQMQSSYNVVRQIESQLEETYRIIYMYEGKIQELQKQLTRLQNKIADNLQTALTAEEIEALFNQYRDDNTELSGNLQRQNRIIMELEQKLRTIQSKYFQTEWKLSTQNRIIANPLKKRFPKLRDTIVIQEMSLSQREKMMSQLEHKYQEMNKQNSKQTPKIKVSNMQKPPINRVQAHQAKESRYKEVIQTPSPVKLTTLYTPKTQTAADNYTMQKVNRNPKTNTNEYTQEWEANKNGSTGYNYYRTNESKRNQFGPGGQQSQNASLNYSLSDGPLMSEGTRISQDRNSSQYFGTTETRYITSQYNPSQQGNQGSQSRVASNTKILSSNSNIISSSTPYQTYDSRNNSTQRTETSYSPSSRVIRVSRQQNQPSLSQNQRDYYQSSNLGSEQGEGKKTRYILRPA